MARQYLDGAPADPDDAVYPRHGSGVDVESRLRRGPALALASRGAGALGVARGSGRQHADETADIGIPDVAVRIDGHTVGASIVAGQPEGLDRAAAQPTKAGATDHTEPDAAIVRHRQAAKASVFSAHFNVREFALLPVAEAIGSKLQE